MKRLFDITCAAAGLVLFGWLILVLARRVRRDSNGPGIFRQARVGRHGRIFTCYKLRTMREGTADAPSHDTHRSAVTALGARLRAWKLDELPQLWNVVRGDMSLVGPRPSLPTQVALVDARRRLGVLQVRPGITGLAQVQGIDMRDPERLARIDADYVRSQSFAGDLRLLVATVLGEGRGDRVRL